MKRNGYVLVLLCAIWAGPAISAQSTTLDRQGLKALADTYLASFVAHDPSKVPLAANVKIVENVKRIKPGEGLWKTVSAPPGEFRIYVPDPAAQQVVLMAVLQADGKPAQLAVRLKVEGGRITEAEHVVVGNLRDTSLPNLKTPRAAFALPVPAGWRDAHDSLLRIGATYYDALDNNNGRLAPFADDCVRFENGWQTSRNVLPPAPSAQDFISALTCGPQLDTNAFEYITRIDNRRVWVADEENGLAVGFSHFRHAFEKNEFAVFGVPGTTSRKLDYKPFDMPAVHIFKIWGGQIHEIEAIGVGAAFNAPTGWE
jgi:hypothetical protein